jgi:hypothetical protein
MYHHPPLPAAYFLIKLFVFGAACGSDGSVVEL